MGVKLCSRVAKSKRWGSVQHRGPADTCDSLVSKQSPISDRAKFVEDLVGCVSCLAGVCSVR